MDNVTVERTQDGSFTLVEGSLCCVEVNPFHAEVLFKGEVDEESLAQARDLVAEFCGGVSPERVFYRPTAVTYIPLSGDGYFSYEVLKRRSRGVEGELCLSFALSYEVGGVLGPEVDLGESWEEVELLFLEFFNEIHASESTTKTLLEFSRRAVVNAKVLYEAGLRL